MRRVFLALPLAEYFLSEITSGLDRIRSQIPEVKWERPEKIHITLHFFGPEPDSSLPQISKAAGDLTRKICPFNLSLKDVGYFPDSRKPRIIWLDVGGETQKIFALQGELEKNFARLGFPSESRSFHPHATIGRVKEGRVPEARFPQLAFPSTSLRRMDRIVLYQSRLESTGSQYEILETFRFSQIAPPERKPA